MERPEQIVGLHDAAALTGGAMLHQLEQLATIAPSLSRFILERGFGEVVAGAATGHREWNLMVLACLTAMGDAADQSEVYLKAALASGATLDEVQDVLHLAYLYAGAPRAVTGARRMADYLTRAREEGLAGAGERLVTLRDHTTAVWDSGGHGLPAQGVPIVLIHALDMDHRFWRLVFPVLAAHARVIAYDIRGHGRARGAPLTTSLNQLADDLGDLMDRLGVPVADVYGASYGGAIAQHAILRMPERVRSMALLATFATSPREELAARATDAEQHGMEAQVAKSVIRWFLPETIAQDLWMVRYARHCVRRARVEEWAAAWRAMAALDVAKAVGGVRQPVLVLSGRQDLSSTPAMMEATAKAYPNSTFVSVDPGTHMMPMEQAGPVAEELAIFRDRVERDARQAVVDGEAA